MKKFGKYLLQNKYIFLIIVAVSILMAWDWIEKNTTETVSGTFRAESEFDAVTGASATVAIVPSDFSELASPIARTSATITDAQIEAMVSKAIELQGGFDGVLSKGDKVLIKPNLVGADEPAGTGENTDVRVVKALVKIIDSITEGDVEIVIGEGSARSNDDVTAAGSVWDNSGYIDLLSDPELAGINVKLLNLNQTLDDLVSVDLLEKATAAPHGGKYKVHKAILEADVYIVVPVLKIHDTGITCSLKNQIGIAPGCYYGYNKMSGTTNYPSGLIHDLNQRRWTDEEIVDLSNIAGIDFVVVDALMCLETSKTDNGNNRVRFNTIIAGKDPVAVDHVCAKLFCLNPDDMDHIVLAEKVGLGTNNSSKIWVKGASIDDTKIRVKKSTAANGTFGRSNRTWLISQAFTGTDISKEYIANEAACIPTQSKDGWSEPIYFFDDRIDLLSYFNASANIVSYAYTNFMAPKAQSAELWIGSDEAMWIYLNGVKVFNFSSITSFADAVLVTDKIPVNIKEGKNTLLVKTLQQYGDYSFTLNICEPETDILYAGNRVSGLYFFKDTVSTPVEPTSIRNNKFTQSPITVFPNPCTTMATIQFIANNSTSQTIQVYNLAGQLVKTFLIKPSNEQEVNIGWDLRSENGTKLPAGHYYISYSTKEKPVKLIIQ